MDLPSQADIEREWRAALRKGPLDYLTDMRAERRLGREEGRVMATIRHLRRVLRQTETDDETLAAMNRVKLVELQSKLMLAAQETGIEVEDI